MKKKSRSLLFLLILFSISAANSSGQISYSGSPASFSNFKSASLIDIPFIEMEHLDNSVLLVEDQINNTIDKNYFFAKKIDVNITPDKDGVWETTKSMRIWRVGIRSQGAYSLNIIFDKMIMPTGASLFIYTPDKKIVRGAFNSNNELSSGIFTIYPVPGDEIVVEYNEPIYASFPGILKISSVNHDFKNSFGNRPIGEAQSCNVDVACSEASNYKDVKQSVIALIVNGEKLCTGTLINNTSNDKTPYLITANHCVSTPVMAQKTLFCFNYESPFCGKNGSLNGNSEQSLNGAIIRANSDYIDFSLLELEQMPPPEFQPYFAGWDKTANIATSSFTIHHPKGDVKKISKDNNPPDIGSFREPTYLKNGFWWIKKWDIGTTENGSSGGPLFNANKKIIGTLTGGSATCSNSIDDYFAMFNKHWDYYPQPEKQAKKWLDPINSGVSTLDGLNPYDNSESCTFFSNSFTDEKYINQHISSGKGYVAGNNFKHLTEYAEKFTQTDRTFVNSILIGIAIAKSNSTNSSFATFNIKSLDTKTNLPGEIIVSKKVLISDLDSEKMNLIQFENPVMVSGPYFVTVEISYSQPSDTIALYHSENRQKITDNFAYAKDGDSWKPLYWIPEIGIKTSLLIKVNGCENILAKPQPPTPVITNKRFSINYPNNINNNFVNLINSGDEEYGKLTIFDVSGRKIYTDERLFIKSPMSLPFYFFGGSGIYIIVIETLTSKEALKVRILE